MGWLLDICLEGRRTVTINLESFVAVAIPSVRSCARPSRPSGPQRRRPLAHLPGVDRDRRSNRRKVVPGRAVRPLLKECVPRWMRTTPIPLECGGHALGLSCLFPCSVRAPLQRRCLLCRPWIHCRVRTRDGSQATSIKNTPHF